MPLMDRSNRMTLRNLRALKDHRRPPSPNLNINQAQQVNVGGQQVNVAAVHADGLVGDAGHPTVGAPAATGGSPPVPRAPPRQGASPGVAAAPA